MPSLLGLVGLCPAQTDIWLVTMALACPLFKRPLLLFLQAPGKPEQSDMRAGNLTQSQPGGPAKMG
jgi:hypothetical protein